jgi:hypothetical protein
MNEFYRRLGVSLLVVLFAVVGYSASAVADRVPEPLAPKNWIGAWKIQATATYSTCGNVSAGDTAVIELTVSTSKNQWAARELNKTTGTTTSLQGATQRSVPPMLLFRHRSVADVSESPRGQARHCERSLRERQRLRDRLRDHRPS